MTPTEKEIILIDHQGCVFRQYFFTGDQIKPWALPEIGSPVCLPGMDHIEIITNTYIEDLPHKMTIQIRSILPTNSREYGEVYRGFILETDS